MIATSDTFLIGLLLRAMVGVANSDLSLPRTLLEWFAFCLVRWLACCNLLTCESMLRFLALPPSKYLLASSVLCIALSHIESWCILRQCIQTPWEDFVLLHINPYILPQNSHHTYLSWHFHSHSEIYCCTTSTSIMLLDDELHGYICILLHWQEHAVGYIRDILLWVMSTKSVMIHCNIGCCPYRWGYIKKSPKRKKGPKRE